jgi:hypothetical protein
VDNDGVEHGPRIQFKQLFGFGINFKFWYHESAPKRYIFVKVDA